jgi:hypothetical protein
MARVKSNIYLIIGGRIFWLLIIYLILYYNYNQLSNEP